MLQYVLSSGKDSLVKLWELSTNRCLIVYTGAGTMGKQEHRAMAAFNHTEDYGIVFHLLFLGAQWLSGRVLD